MNDTPDYILKLSGLIVVALTENRVLSERIEMIERSLETPIPEAQYWIARAEHHRQTILETLELRSPELAAHISLLFPDPPETQ